MLRLLFRFRRWQWVLLCLLAPAALWAQGGTASKATNNCYSNCPGNTSPSGNLQGVGDFQFTFTTPGTLSNPANAADCDAIQQKQDQQLNQIEAMHESCLSQNEAAHTQHLQTPTLADCSFAVCQSIHNQMMTARSYSSVAMQNAQACRDSYAQAQAEKQRQIEAQRQKEEAEKEAKEKADELARKQQQARDQARAEAAAKQRQAQADAQAAQQAAQLQHQKVIDQDMQNIQAAQAQADSNRSALAQRTAARDAQVGDLDANLSAADAAGDDRLAQAQQQVAEMSDKILGDDPGTTVANAANAAAMDDYALPAKPSGPAPPDWPMADPVSSVFPSDPAVAQAYQTTQDPPQSSAEVAQMQQELLPPTPSPSVMDGLHDGLETTWAAAKQDYQAAKTTLGQELDSPAAQRAVDLKAIFQDHNVPLPQASDSPELQEEKVRVGANVGIVKTIMAAANPKALYDSLSRNIDASMAQLDNYFASFGMASGTGSDGNGNQP